MRWISKFNFFLKSVVQGKNHKWIKGKDELHRICKKCGRNELKYYSSSKNYCWQQVLPVPNKPETCNQK